jgi:hypothetical protein
VTEKRGPGGGIANDGSTYIVDVPAEHPDMKKPYLAAGMTVEEMLRSNPWMSEEEAERLALWLASPEFRPG